MEQRDFFYVIFWSFAMAFVAYFLGFGPIAAAFFAMSLAGCAVLERVENPIYMVGAAVVALGFVSYFSTSFYFLSDRVSMGMMLFLVLPGVLSEVRKLTGSKAPAAKEATH
ncbi:MAG: hypothetical protein PHS02_02670 [Candidatus ainarchaeum sp.]|nr:hypothetical protein [Candidatus ainarchaeum sp.]